MQKTNKSPEEIYKGNQAKSKLFKRISPIIYWGCLVLAILFLFLAIRNSLGNVAEICDMLDSKKYSGEELRNNYNYLTDKFGEWVIGNGSHGFTITFINIGHAVFSGVMILSCFLSMFFFAVAHVLGKWLLPHMAEQILQDNDDMVNLTILRDHEQLENEK